MPDLFDRIERAELLRRLDTLTTDATPRWGRMTPDRMLVHLIDAFALTFGERAVSVQPGFLSSPLGRWLVLCLPLPRGRITAPPIFHQTEPDDFERDRERVAAAIERFAAAGPEAQWSPSPIFGQLSTRQWSRLHRKHLHHHLTQFGV